MFLSILCESGELGAQYLTKRGKWSILKATKPKGKRIMEKKDQKTKKPVVGRCEDCEFYDYDEELDAYVCQVNLDEDEMISFISGQTGRCPYYRYYDEYKSVHKQI
jgi:hypothetical protein